MRRLRILLCLVLGSLVTSSLARTPLSAPVQAWEPDRAIQVAGWHWSGRTYWNTPAAELRWYAFRSTDRLPVAARLLAHSARGTFSRLQLQPGAILLSGMAGADHWVAHLEADQAGTRGVVSALRPRTSAEVPAVDVTRFAPRGARPILVGQGRSAGTGRLSSFLCDGPIRPVASYVARALRADGWSVAEGAVQGHGDGPLATDWQQRSGHRLSVDVRAHAEGVVLTFWLHPDGDRS